MKKLITLSMILAVSIAAVTEAKVRSSGFRTTGAPKALATKPVVKQQSQQSDATFANTPNNTTAQPQIRNGNTMANVAMGAAAGYILGDMMSSTAQANQTAETISPQQAVNSVKNIANDSSVVAEFKSIGGQIDPFLIEKTDGYRRYCISGVQYLAAAQAGQAAPVVMVNPNGSPLQCHLVP